MKTETWTKIEKDFIDFDNKGHSNASQRQILDWFKIKLSEAQPEQIKVRNMKIISEMANQDELLRDQEETTCNHNFQPMINNEEEPSYNRCVKCNDIEPKQEETHTDFYCTKKDTEKFLGVIPSHPAKEIATLIQSEYYEKDFVDWIYENRYSKYWGSDAPNNHKWYKQNTMPNRKYYTTDELYKYWKINVKAKLSDITTDDLADLDRQRDAYYNRNKLFDYK